MEKEQAFRLLDEIAQLEHDVRKFLDTAFEIKDLPSKIILVRPREVCRTIGFIEKGIIRAYRFDDKGEEKTSYFMQEGDVWTSIRSFLKQVPSEEFVETLEPCRMISLRYDQYMHVHTTYQSFQKHRAELLQKYYLLAEEREEMRQKKQFDQFCHFMDHFPGLLGRVADKHIASFLGLTPNHFSSVKTDYLIKYGRRPNI